MESLLLLTEVPYSLDEKKLKLDLVGNSYLMNNDERLVFKLGERSIALEKFDLPSWYKEEVLTRTDLTTPNCISLNYREIDLIKYVLDIIIDDDLWVDTDFGDIMAGREFKERLRNDPNWDWRKTSGL